MRLIDKKYRKLQPHLSYFSDKIVIAQAWKKTQTYIRTHNWYADTLALDVSALGLETSVKTWSKNIKDVDFTPNTMELIPAPKSQKWVVDEDEGWVREASLYNDQDEELKKKKKPIRPLAHLTIRDQTLASAAMLCLADIVETKQGDNNQQDFIKAQQKGVYSYGNRLICDWKDNKAWFRWGNNQTYRKYFTDYRLFLNRPITIGRYIASTGDEAEKTYVVSLDISRFYDCIDRDILIDKLKSLQKADKSDVDEEFWTTLRKLINWDWDERSKKFAQELNLELGNGIPQGLVASGFFANAYLIDFDSAIGKSIGNSIPDSGGAILHDYCRYVDDIRIVVSVEENVPHELLAKSIHSMFRKVLSRTSRRTLRFNRDKTKITSLIDLDSMGSLSRRIDQIQGELSGPIDRDVIDGTLGVLEGFIMGESEKIPENINDLGDKSLLKIAKFDHNIRPDTVKRFSANRLELLMRSKRRISESTPDEGPLPYETIDNESELLAKKLIWSWMQDPSLSLVLRKSFEIFPNPRIAEPVFEALFKRSRFNENETDKITSCVAEYTIADIFRACVDFHSSFQRFDYPKSSDPKGLLALACQYAQKALSHENLPVFIQRQALLLLAVMEKPIQIPISKPLIQHTLHAILAGNSIKWRNQDLALFEIASQITGNPSIFSKQLIPIIKKLDDLMAIGVIDELAKRGGEFWNYVWNDIKRSKIKKSLVEKFKWAMPVRTAGIRFGKQLLSKLIASESNVLIHEAALLKLALALIECIEQDSDIVGCSPAQLLVLPSVINGQKNWDNLWKEEYSITVKKDLKKDFQDPRFKIPYWLSDENDSDAIYWIGAILRASVVGQNDFTSYRWKKSETVGYKGLRTGWYKRRMGMMHAPEALVGEYATLSSWSAELLMTCLQWPGFESTHVQDVSISSITDLETFKSSVSNQLLYLNKIQCKYSNIPAIITKANRPSFSKSGKFRLVTVQQLLPRSEDFSISDPTLSNSKTKQINREHLSKVCQLAYRTLSSQAEQNSSPIADLIVFPEVAIHPEDQDIVKRLADKTRAMIFAGLIFTDNNGDLINNARWLIPSYQDSGRQWIVRDQGKAYPTTIEKKYGVVPNRPCQHIIEVHNGNTDGPFKISGAICYDATDLKLASDLKGLTDLFVVVAHNKDVATFDAMAIALHYHMYQHVVVVNKGQYGGSTIQAPYKESYDRLISHSHGTNQISINIADLDLAAFRRKSQDYKAVKTPPAGI